MITLKTLPQASAQEVFNQVKNHMLSQMQRSESPTSCLYRYTEDNVTLKCAAGCLIADDEYVPEMDASGNGTSWGNLVKEGLVPEHETMDLIVCLQDIHDSTQPCNWERELFEAAKNWNLKWE